MGSGFSSTALTNAQGVAVSPALTANSTVGSYAVTASVGSLAPVLFTLNNTASSTLPPPTGKTSIWPDSTIPAIPSAVTGTPSEMGVKVPIRRQRHCCRHSVLQRRSQHGNAYGLTVDVHGNVARHRHVHERNQERVADAFVQLTGGDLR